MQSEESLNLFTKIIFIFSVYIFVYFIFFAFTYPSPDGDSINYHIPLAKSFLDGTILTPEKIEAVPYLKYFPGSSEGILAIFFLFRIPMQLFNVVGILFLFIIVYFLGKIFNLGKNLSLVFAVSIATLPAMIRWINMQIIDIWMLGFFTLTFLLLERPRKNFKYFAILGFSCGMLIGSKYTGPIFASVLFIFYFKKIISYLSIKRILIFLIPFSIFGLFWYIRNFIVLGNPFYPQNFLFFRGDNFGILNNQVWETTITTPGGIRMFIDAFFSEYSLWFFSIILSIFIIFKSFNKRKKSKILFISLIGISNFIIWLFLPSDRHFHIFVSVVRYSFPSIVPIILAAFLYAKEKGKEDVIYLVTFVSLLASPIYKYHPKVLLVVFPIAFIIYFFGRERLKGKTITK